MKQNFKLPEVTYFVLCGEGLDTVNRGGIVGLAKGYVDHQGALLKGTLRGKYVEYATSIDDRGREKAKYFRFDESLRRLMTREYDTDVKGLSQYEFLKNYPTCEGSPYGDYIEEEGVMVQRGVQFREMNDAKDAEVALEADELRINAQAEALGLDEQTLSEVAANIGLFGKPDKMMRLKVVEYAGKRPADFNKIMEQEDRAVRAIVRRAVNERVFNTKGSVIYFDQTLIGADENSAIATLLKEPDMLKALQEKLGLPTEISTPKRKPGNPAFSKKKED